MSILEPVSRPFSDIAYVGTAITRTPYGLHSGFLYKLPDQDPRLLHLAFHHQLRDEPPSSEYRWANLGLDEDNLIILMELLARVARKHPSVPYGFNHQGIAIDPATGDVMPAPPGFGLTCATFMVALLKVYGHDLLQADKWPVREDDAAWEATIIELLAGRAPVEHIDAVRGNSRSARLRPDEIVGSGTLDEPSWPSDYPTARALADQVLADLVSSD